MFRSNVSAKYTSRYNTGSDLHPVKDQEAFTLVNARIGIGSADERWSVELYSNNLFDQDYIASIQALYGVGAYGAYAGEPRMIGTTVRLRLP